MHVGRYIPDDQVKGSLNKLEGGQTLNNLTLINTNGKFTVDSREVAEMVGKQHSHLLRDIKMYKEILDLNPNLDSANFFIESDYTDTQSQLRTCFLLTRKGCDMVANKMTGEKGVLFTATYVTKFEEMEKQTNPLLNLSKELQAIFITDQKVQKLEAHISELDEKVDNQITVSFNQANGIQKAVSSRIIELLGGKETNEYKFYKGSYFQQLYRDLKDRLGVPSYRDIRKIDYKKTLDYIKAWLPKAEQKGA